MDFLRDDLGRQKFADLMASYIANLSAASVLPAGRVLAVDAPWGSGKSWIARRLPKHFENDKRIGKCIYIDAFQFDYHQDPFAVITSTIIEGYKDQSKKVADFKKAAKGVLQAGAPAVAKSIVNVGFKAVGIDSDAISAAISEGMGNASEKTIEAMLTTAAKTSAATEAFKQKLTKLATQDAENAPLVLVIDELDRCRPSYALELLERIKHLFDVPNVVFVLFVHTPALHSAIRKTYGSEIDPSGYLRKFISVTIGLPIAETSNYSIVDRTEFFEKFLKAQYPLEQAPSQQEDQFRESVVAFASVFNASFRDIENVMLLWQLIAGRTRSDSLLCAYLLLLKVCDENQLKDLRRNSTQAITRELARFIADKDGRDHNYVDYIRAVLAFGVNAPNYIKEPSAWAQSTPLNAAQAGFQNLMRAVTSLDLEYLRV